MFFKNGKTNVLSSVLSYTKAALMPPATWSSIPCMEQAISTAPSIFLSPPHWLKSWTGFLVCFKKRFSLQQTAVCMCNNRFMCWLLFTSIYVCILAILVMPVLERRQFLSLTNYRWQYHKYWPPATDFILFFFHTDTPSITAKLINEQKEDKEKKNHEEKEKMKADSGFQDNYSVVVASGT